jgi:cyclophilin family peptidyl-prolyl cis-trans isomerase
MKRIKVSLFSLFLFVILCAQDKYPDITIETEYGNMVISLYDETPLHCQNFVKLVNEGYYNEQLFHRVIKNFMIQSGDPDSKEAKPKQMLGRGGPAYTIPAEINSKYYHKKGALAAARQGDNINPKKESSGSQFYIVQGRAFTQSELEKMLQQGMHMPFTQEQFTTYTTTGGSPHLDNEYTIFGELIEGFNVLDSIAKNPVDKYSRPIKDIRIIKAYTKK